MKVYKTSEFLPQRSGDYLCLNVSGLWQVLSYSKKHQAFNASDYLDETNCSMQCTHWAELPEVENEKN
jgi:hypothetical protein